MMTKERFEKIFHFCKLAFLSSMIVAFFIVVISVISATFYFHFTRHESIIYCSSGEVALSVKRLKYIDENSNLKGVVLECLLHHEAMRYMSIRNGIALIRFVADEKKKENWKIDSYSLFEHQDNKYVDSSIKHVNSKSDWCFVVSGIDKNEAKDYTVVVYLKNITDVDDGVLDKRDEALQGIYGKVQKFDLEL